MSAYSGLRVLDASREIPGAIAAMHLADQGAEVVRLLPPGTDLLARDPGYLCWDRNKMLCFHDRDDAAGRAEVRRLAAAADVVVVDDPHDVLVAAGLTADALLAVAPRLVHVWMPVHGPAEPWGALPPDRLLADAVNTASSEHGSYDGGPIALATPVPFYEQGVLGAVAAAAGLYERNRSGEGQGVLVSGLHAMAAMHAAVLTDAPGMMRATQKGSGSLASYRLYQCADGRWIYLGALSDPMLIAALGVLDLVDVLTMPGVEGRMINLMNPEVGEPVAARLAARFAERPAAEWVAAFSAANVPSAPVQTRDEWWHSDVVASNGMRQLVPHPQLGTVELPGDPVRLARTPGRFSHLPGAAVAVAAEIWRTPPADPIRAPGGARGGGPLAGLKVLDAGAFLAGPFGASVLTDLGADVTRVEAPSGDPYRAFSVSFLAFHKGQRAIVLNLKDERGQAAVQELARSADVLLDNLRPGAPERNGTDDATLRALNPRIVRGTVTAWGPGNSLSTTPAFDPLLQSRSGLLAAQGGNDEPCVSGMLVHDMATGSLLAFGILAALYARDRDGVGQEVRTTMANASVMMQSGELVHYAGRHPVAVGGRNYRGDRALHRLYACRDGWIALAGDGHPDAVARVLGVEQCSPDAPASGPAATALAAAFALRDSAEVLAALGSAGVPAAPVLPREGITRHPWLVANHLFSTIEDPDFGACTVVRGYADWSRSRSTVTTPAARFGADTREVLREAGIDPDEVEALIRDGVAVQAAPVAAARDSVTAAG